MIRTALVRVTLLISLFGFAVVGGCGDSKDSGDGARTPAAATLNAAGTYSLDKEAVKAAMQAEIDKIEDPMEKMGASMMLGMIDMMSITITLNEDGTATGTMAMGGDEDPASGSWTLDGNVISITMASEGDSPETMTGTFDGDTIRLSDADDEMPFQMVFKRVQG